MKRFIYNIIFGKKITLGKLQLLEKYRIVIKNQGNISIGERNQNRGNLYLEANTGSLSIGDHCFFNINCSITCFNSIVVGNYCKFGNNLVMVDHNHNFRKTDSEYIKGSIVIGNNVWIGANVTILMNTQIGDNCVIGAGSVVSGKVNNNTIMYQKRETVLRIIE